MARKKSTDKGTTRKRKYPKGQFARAKLEQQILTLLAIGKTPKEVSDELDVEKKVVEQVDADNAYRVKMSTPEVVAKAREANLLVNNYVIKEGTKLHELTKKDKITVIDSPDGITTKVEKNVINVSPLSVILKANKANANLLGLNQTEDVKELQELMIKGQQLILNAITKVIGDEPEKLTAIAEEIKKQERLQEAGSILED